MPRRIAFLVAFSLAVTAAGAAAPGAAPALHGNSFKTPSGNIACEVDQHAAVGPFKGRRTLFCVIFSASSPTHGQRTWLMAPTGAARVTWVVGNIATDVAGSRTGGRGASRASRAGPDASA